MNLPNFFVVGAAKAGTTSLFHYLKNHPEIFIPDIKEPSFFSFANKEIKFKEPVNRNYKVPKIFNKLDDYLNLFRFSSDYKIIADFSTPYLYFYKDTINNMEKFLPNYKEAKFVIILRNPVDRAFSQYMHNIRDLRETLSFEEAIKIEKERMKDGYHFDFFYIDRGFYYEQVKAFLENFDNIKIYLFEEFILNPRFVVKDILQFLNVNDSYSDSIDFSKKYNISGKPKFKWINFVILSQNSVLKNIKKYVPQNMKNLFIKKIFSKNLEKETLNLETRKYLISIYKEDILKLSNLINRDLSSWINL